jgi:periplasmic divalent cation tolerance protein
VRVLNEFIQVLTTVDDEKKASEIARVLLEKHVAACVQVLGPIASSYWWNGKIERTNEWMCIAKARAADYEIIESAIRGIHTYEVPEILAFSIYSGYPAYLKWIREETAPR